MSSAQGRCVSAAPWFNLARQQLQPLQQHAVVACVRLLGETPPGAASAASSSRDIPSATRVASEGAAGGGTCGGEAQKALRSRRQADGATAGGARGVSEGTPAGGAGGGDALGAPGSGHREGARGGRARVWLAHAELAACAAGPAWEGGTSLALSGGQVGAVRKA